MYFLLKTIISGLLIAGISTLSKKSSFIGGLIASLPLTSLLAFIWLYHEGQTNDQLSELSYEILWLVLPSLTLFISLPFILKRGFSFYPALIFSSILTIISYFVFIKTKQYFYS